MGFDWRVFLPEEKTKGLVIKEEPDTVSAEKEDVEENVFAEDEKENEGKRTYYRVYCVDCSEDDVMDKLRDMFDKVFHQMATRVVVETLEEGSHVAEVVSNLRELPFLHFTK